MNKQVSHIPSGYKPSPLGIIPEDWEVKRLGEVGEVFSGGTPNTEIQEYWNGNIDWCTPTDITLLNGAVYIERTALKITDLGLKSSSAVLLPPNSIIVCTRATIGNAAISLHQIATNQGFKNIVPNENIDTLFLYYTIVNNKIRLIRLGNGSTFLEVSKSDFENLTIPVPPLPEQQRIVSVLSLWDTAIAKQTALIEKLTLRKRGLMQQLLTGKTRLKGLEREWKNIKLGSIAERITRKNEEDNKNVVTISAQRGFVVQTGFFNKSVASEILDGYFLVHKDEFCYNKSYSNGYPMGAIKRLKSFDKAVVTTLYICFRLKEKPQTNIDFFEQYCESGLLNKELVKVANEGGRAHGLLNVTPSDFFNMHMSVPSINEQNAIALVLVTADKEIELANEKLARLQEEKRGLMQVLLTGKKRVK